MSRGNQTPATRDLPYRTTTDALGRIRYSPMPSSTAAVANFQRFQRTVLEHGPGCGLAAHLVGFESVCHLSDLHAALQACTDSCFYIGTDAYLDWPRKNNWRDQRLLSSATLTAMAQTPRNNTGKAEELALCKLARDANPQWQHLSHEQALDRLFASAQAWAVFTLPPMLAAHTLGDVPLQPLPRSALARYQTHLALASIHERPQSICADHVEALEVALTGSNGSDPAVIADVVKACAIGKQSQGSAQHRRERMRERLAEAAGHARNWTDGLITGWAIHLLEMGTRGKAILAPGTIANYVYVLAEPLATALCQLPELPTAAESWVEVYRQVRKHVTGSMRDASSARSSFHDYLMFAYGIDPLPPPEGWEHEDRPPRANILWPHEYKLIQQWLTDATGDQRLMETLLLIMRLAQAVRLRTDEVLRLRLRNVTPYQHELEVYPLPKDGPGKSTSAARMLQLDAETAQRLHRWTGRRRAEGATDDDYLFGDPYRPSQIYRPGATVASMINLVQHVSGDPDVVFHTTSHTWVSNAITDMHQLSGCADIDPLDQVAAGAGHFSASTLTHYYHRYPTWLRSSIDEGVDRSVSVSSATAAQYTGVSAAALRQRKARSANGATSYWRLICKSQIGIDLQSASQPFELTCPTPPAWISTPPRNQVAQIANALEDIARGDPVDRVAMRSGFSSDEIGQIAKRALELLRAIGAWQSRRRLTPIDPQTAVLQFEAWCKTGPAKWFDFSRRRQGKFAPIATRLPKINNPAWHGWIEGFERGYLRLGSDNASVVLHWLRDCGTPPLRLAISAQSSLIDSPRANDLKQIFKIAFGISPLIFSHAAGEGRPDFYLIWSGETIGEMRPAPASCSLAGLHAWMLAASCVLEQPLPIEQARGWDNE